MLQIMQLDVRRQLQHCSFILIRTMCSL